MDKQHHVEAELAGRLLVLGTGCIAEGVLPLLWRHLALRRDRVALLGPDPEGAALAQRHGVDFHRCALTPGNFASELGRHLRAGDVLLNLALGVSSLDLLAWCRQREVLYLDSNLEPWAGQPRRLHAARSAALAPPNRVGSTAVVGHGANPGLVTHLLKTALCRLVPSAATWPEAARRLGLQVLQVSEFDSHVAQAPCSSAEFANTWSAHGLAGELSAPAEIGWGSQEWLLPPRVAVSHTRNGLALELDTPGGATRVRAWSPGAGEFEACLLAHHEAISMADLLTATDTGAPTRPTVFYAVRPCAAAQAALQAIASPDPLPMQSFRVMKDVLRSGGNELGVLLLGDRVGHWYGTRLSLAAARRCAPDNNATSLQVAAGVLGGLVWALENPQRGVVEAEDMDAARVLAVAAPYLGELVGIDTPWRPVQAGPLRFEHFLLPGKPVTGSASTA